MGENTTVQKRERIIWLSVCTFIIVIALLAVLSYHKKLNNLNLQLTALEESETAFCDF